MKTRAILEFLLANRQITTLMGTMLHLFTWNPTKFSCIEIKMGTEGRGKISVRDAIIKRQMEERERSCWSAMGEENGGGFRCTNTFCMQTFQKPFTVPIPNYFMEQLPMGHRFIYAILS
jgi:hypothetical protein